MFELVFMEGSPRSARWLWDGQPLGSEIALDGPTLRALDGVRIAFQGVFDRHVRPLVDPDAVRALGLTLSATFFQPVESHLPPLTDPGPHTLLIRSLDVELFNLPWELVCLPGRDVPIGCDPTWALLRVPGSLSTPVLPPPDPGPLRLLFLAAAPEGDVPLDYEREEEAMLRATERLDRNVVVLPFAETGGIDELAKLVADHRPHVVHLSGHGSVDNNGTGWFGFENERGRPDPQPADQIANRVFRGSAVRCVMLNACQTGLGATAGLAGHLVSTGVPVVLGWGASVGDDMATRFAATLYRFLAAGDRVPAAAAKARHDIWQADQSDHAGHRVWDLTFALPRLFASGPDPDLIDRSVPPRKYEGPKTEPMLLGDDIKGLREGFVGRRREQQRLIPPLRDGSFSILVLTGIGGMGKSTLATRTASRLKEAGFDVYAIKATRCATPAEAGRLFLLEKLVPALARSFMASEPDIYKAIRNGEYPVEDRVALAVDEWKKRKLALVIDNFEDVLDPDRSIADPGLRTAYHTLTRNLTEGGRLVVTCRYCPADTPDPAGTPHVHIWDVKDLKPFELRKFLRRDEKVEARMRVGVISDVLIERMHRVFGGTPGFLVQVRAWLGTGDLDGWEDEIPDDTPLEEARQAYCEGIMLPRLYGLLPEAARELASRLAVSELPLPPDGLAKVANRPEMEAAAAAESAVHYGLVQRFTEAGKPTLYHIPGLIRGWLTAAERLPPDDRLAVDGILARFWKDGCEQGRADELQVVVDVELLTCRIHAARADLRDVFRWATVLLGHRLTARAEWKTARSLLSEIPDGERNWSVWYGLGTIDLEEGDYSAARKAFGESLTIAQTTGDRFGEAAALHQLATTDVHEGNYATAREGFETSMSIRQEIGDKAGESATLNNLATIDLYQGKYPTARDTLDKALTIKQLFGDKVGEAATLHQLATIDVHESNYPAARGGFQKVLVMRQEIGDRAGEAAAWHNLASIDINEGDYQAARDKFGKAVTIRQGIGDKAGEAISWHQLATIDLHQGDFAVARDKYEKALAIQQRIGNRAGEAATLHGLATIDVSKGDYPAARKKFLNSLAIERSIGNRAGEAATWHSLASMDLNEKHYPAARDKFGKALTIMHAIGDRAGEAANVLV
ncbi:MAG: photosystem assembly protein Ycf3 [Gemmataceae bacterium]|nr:photosystem assembly protein Ycf3 [Gemmataceae bacterium]